MAAFKLNTDCMNLRVMTPQRTVFERLLAIGLFALFSSVSGICLAQQPGTKLWEVTLGAAAFSPAIGPDGTIYVSADSRFQNARMFYAISPQGTTNWTFLAGAPIGSSPALGADGTIYFGASDGLYALNPSGMTNWIFEYSGQRCSSPAVGADGTIYLVTWTNDPNSSYPSRLHAISPAGTVNWSGDIGSGAWGGSVQFPSPSIGPDGSIYVGSLSGQLYSISYSGSTNWIFPLDWSWPLGAATYSTPAIGGDGTIYMGAESGKVYAIHRNGSRRWVYPSDGSIVESTPTIDQTGNLYFGSLGGAFSCLNSNGVRTWFRVGGYISGSAAIAADGTVYVSSYGNRTLYAYSSAGSNLWSFNLAGDSFSSPAIGSNGTIYVGGGTKLYAVAVTAPPQNSSWPMFRRDAHNNARSVQRSIQAIRPLPDGNVEMQLLGETGRDYGIEASTNLTTWEMLGSFNFIAPSVPFADVAATNFSQRYYRLSTSQ